MAQVGEPKPSASKVKPEDREPLADMHRGGKTGDEGLAILYRRYAAKLTDHLHYAPRYLKYQISLETAEEICDDTFIDFHKNIGRYKENCSVETWLRTIIHNKLMDYIRRGSQYKQMLREQKAQKLNNALLRILWQNGLADAFLFAEKISQADIERDICFKECMEKMLDAMQDGPDAGCYKALTCQALCASMQEAAEKLGKSLNATKVFLATTCRKKMRENTMMRDCIKECLED
ncbi:MAG: hypothetical protein GY862_05905 [Gammaproteobacteria bacterium]|nr:hypothetical protein [Gammaproteobacteria bacterium]